VVLWQGSEAMKLSGSHWEPTFLIENQIWPFSLRGIFSSLAVSMYCAGGGEARRADDRVGVADGGPPRTPARLSTEFLAEAEAQFLWEVAAHHNSGSAVAAPARCLRPLAPQNFRSNVSGTWARRLQDRMPVKETKRAPTVRCPGVGPELVRLPCLEYWASRH
jgi:hypothetical protein